MHLQACVEEFEHVGADSLHVSFAWVFLEQVNVLKSQLVQVVHLAIVEESWVFQYAFARHHSINSCNVYALLDVVESRNATIGDDWNIERLLDLSNYVIVGTAAQVLVVLLASSMDGQQGRSSILDG